MAQSETDLILNKLPEYLNKSNTSNNYGFIKSFAEVTEQIGENNIELKDNIYVQTATGEYLDKIGAMFGIPRDGLTDDMYRDKIISTNTSELGGGTIGSIKDAIASTYGLDEDDITISDTAIALIFLVSIAIDEGINITDMNNISSIVQDKKAAATYFKNPQFTSKGGVFRINVSSINGSDLIL